MEMAMPVVTALGSAVNLSCAYFGQGENWIADPAQLYLLRLQHQENVAAKCLCIIL